MEVLRREKIREEILLIIIVLLVLFGALKRIVELNRNLDEADSFTKELIIESENLRYDIDSLKAVEIENIKKLNQKITELEKRRVVPSPEQKSKPTQNSSIQVKKIDYVIGKKKELLDNDILKNIGTKMFPVFKVNEKYHSDYSPKYFNNIGKEYVIEENVPFHLYTILPKLQGARVYYRNNQIKLNVSDFSQIKNGQKIVIYYNR